MPKRTPGTPSKKAANAPFAKFAENTTSPVASSSSSPKPWAGRTSSPRVSREEPRDPHDAFLLPRTSEQTQHRRLRTLLADFVRETTEWEEVHTLDGIKWASDAKQTWEEMASLLRRPESASSDAPPADMDDEKLRASLIPLLQNLEQSTVQLHKMVERLVRLRSHQKKHAARITALSDMGTDLLIETADGGRESAAFVDPMWATWTMDQFVLAIRSLAQQYAVSTAEIAALVPRLCDASDDPAMLAKKRAALEEFVRLPHLHPSGLSGTAPAFGADASLATGVSRHFLEHVCEAEVRGWA
ncbi:uncharacterized protein MJAP1_000500 [Malassezia japonica]|uniref:Uncharacterized protein n=1 Tax=Malassezia japonica TaxID=223818 RepID=A0AAF0EVB4_9BASI|nr:uncharacterized protein MJAP1_000500 [Malassezia japonica]WFD37555.1 hypothetical protein MJAP1_000500 [Malassezia japonica]